MKYNPRANEEFAGLEGFAGAHPCAPDAAVQGTLEVLFRLERRGHLGAVLRGAIGLLVLAQGGLAWAASQGAGSVLITAIGTNMLKMPRIRVGNLLPAIFLPPACFAVKELIIRFVR